MWPLLLPGSQLPEVRLLQWALNDIRIQSQQPEIALSGTFDQSTQTAVREFQARWNAPARLPIGTGLSTIRADGNVDGPVWSALGLRQMVQHKVRRFGQTAPNGCWISCAEMLSGGTCRDIPPTLQVELGRWTPGGGPIGLGSSAELGLNTSEHALDAYARFVSGRRVAPPLDAGTFLALLRGRPIIGLGRHGRRGPRHALIISASWRMESQDIVTQTTSVTHFVRVEDPAPMPSGATYCAKLQAGYLACHFENFFLEHLIVR